MSLINKHGLTLLTITNLLLDFYKSRDSDADSVVVTWWESNQTSDTPVMRMSNDNGVTFGLMLVLATSGTIGESSRRIRIDYSLHFLFIIDQKLLL